MKENSNQTVIRVFNRGGTSLIVLAILLGGLAVILATMGHGESRWIGVALTGGISMICFHHRLVRRLRYIDLGDEISAMYWRRRTVIQWSDVVSACVQSVQTNVRTRIPGVVIPTKDHWIELRMRDGSWLTANVEADKTEELNRILKQRVIPDPEWLLADQVRTEKSDKSFDRWAGVVFGIVLIGIGFFVANEGVRELLEGVASMRWPTTQAIQFTSEIGVKERKSEKTSDRIQTYFPVVRYTYVVDGKEYSGARYSIDQRYSPDSSSVENLLKGISQHSTLSVRYDPNDPSVSVLVPGCKFMTYTIVVVGVLTILGGACYALVKYREVKSEV